MAGSAFPAMQLATTFGQCLNEVIIDLRGKFCGKGYFFPIICKLRMKESKICDRWAGVASKAVEGFKLDTELFEAACASAIIAIFQKPRRE
jgi:hypothetical protein